MTHLVVGELCADIVVTLDADVEFGQAERIVPATEVVMGSSSAITACGLARLGVPTALVSVVGDDLLGGFLLGELRDRGVNTTYVRVDRSMPTGTSTILTRPDGDRAILTSLGSIGQVSVTDTPSLEGVGHVHVGSYFLQYALHGSLAAWFASLRASGVRTSVDPNDDPAGTWDSGVLEVVAHADYVFCNAEEASAMGGVDRLVGTLPEGGLLVLKRGAAGASALDRSGELASCAPPEDPRPLADTVGAGDSLAAGFLAARARGLDVTASLEVGVRNATASTRATGGTAAQLTWDQASAQG